jgi:ATP-dependent RNA helicase RhlE
VEESGQLRDIERLTRQAIPSEDRRQPKGAGQAEPMTRYRSDAAHRRNEARPDTASGTQSRHRSNLRPHRSRPPGRRARHGNPQRQQSDRRTGLL